MARLGGDEFAILQTNLADNEAAAILPRRLGQYCGSRLYLMAQRLLLGASIGTAIHPGDGANIEELLSCADIAMYKAKRNGGDRHEFYTADMMFRACQSAQLDAELRLAIERERFRAALSTADVPSVRRNHRGGGADPLAQVGWSTRFTRSDFLPGPRRTEL